MRIERETLIVKQKGAYDDAIDLYLQQHSHDREKILMNPYCDSYNKIDGKVTFEIRITSLLLKTPISD